MPIAGKSTRDMASRRRSQAIWIAIIGISIIAIIGLLIPNAEAFGIGGIGILVLFFLIRYLIPEVIDGIVTRKLKDEKRAVRGAVAEEDVENTLFQLGQDFEIISDIENPFGNIDHLVVGKYSGIFLIETKSHHGKVEVINGSLMINGIPPEKDFISQTIRSVYWLREEINQVTGMKPWITTIIVFTNAFVPHLQPIKGIIIINKRFLLSTIQNRSANSPINNQIWAARETIIKRLIER